jgi:hypothetical protein
MVGVTGFEPATSTSQRLWENVENPRAEYRHKEGECGVSGRFSHGIHALCWPQLTKIYMAALMAELG